MSFNLETLKQFFGQAMLLSNQMTDIILCPLPQYSTGFDYPNIVGFRNVKNPKSS